MDVLSDVIAAMRTGRPHSNLMRRRAPWSSWFESASGAGFHVLLQGSCWLLRPAAEPIALGVGDVVFLRPGAAEHGLADSPQTSVPPSARTTLADPDTGVRDAEVVMLCGAYLMDRSMPHPLLTELPEVVHLPARLGRYPHLRAATELLGAELERPGHGTDVVVTGLLDTLLLYILRAWYDEQAHCGRPGWAAALADPSISVALRDMHDDPAHPWTVGELAGCAGLSRAAFAKRFAQLVGRSPLAYLTWWRMTTAAKALRDTDEPLAVIAGRAGYTSEFAFAKAFKREFAAAPGAYRRSSRNRTATDLFVATADRN
ncbi:AraC family transcriptional regulator [Nocardia sp. CY41]|uniref:AraC family transcriptional regulator n=1 Tax=Nocardia sp. CY41 TaxID=2608686 RepID=UPI001359173D|nr:AraC family transcriptional regulator [Nocardia sp. CY41]